VEKILFESATIYYFRKKDLEILKRHFEVTVFSKSLDPSFFAESVRKIMGIDIVFSWFATKRALYFALLSKLFRKRFILVSGGNDVVEMPEIGFTFGFLRRLQVKTTLLLADRVLVFSDSSKASILELAPRANVETVYVGAIDTGIFRPDRPKEDLTVTVGIVSWGNVERKGLNTFVKAAAYLPVEKFAVIGRWEDDSIDHLRSMSTPNVVFAGYLPLDELVEWYRRARVYVQVSLHEGFGIAVAEAMSCECVPVVTREGAIPEVVGDTGYYVPYGDPKATAEAIEKALRDEEKGKKARKRVIKLFSLERREKELVNVIKTLARA
jgi:glycosyltransferase involved in cell wall biosynthesis